jgi:hypothetical protein
MAHRTLDQPLLGAPNVRGLGLNSPRGGSTLVVYLFGGRSSRARNSMVMRWHTDKKDTTILCWFRPPESKTLRLVLGVCIVNEGIGGPQKDTLAHLILATRQGQWT